MDRWLFPITGRSEDLAVLRHGLRTGPQRLEDHTDQHGTDVCLCDRRIDPKEGGVEALGAAKLAVEDINSIFSYRRGQSYRPVALTGAAYEGMPDGSRRARPIAIGRQSSQGRATFVPTAPDPTILTRGVPKPSWEELYLKAVEIEPCFGQATRLAQGSISDVCRAFETIKRRGKPGPRATNEGFRVIRDRGWLTPDELTNLYETCKPARHGLPPEPVTRGVELTVSQAQELVRRLLDHWAEEISARKSVG